MCCQFYFTAIVFCLCTCTLCWIYIYLKLLNLIGLISWLITIVSFVSYNSVYLRICFIWYMSICYSHFPVSTWIDFFSILLLSRLCVPLRSKKWVSCTEKVWIFCFLYPFTNHVFNPFHRCNYQYICIFIYYCLGFVSWVFFLPSSFILFSFD